MLAFVGLAITVLATQFLLAELGAIAIPIGFAIGQAGKVVLLALALVFRLRDWQLLALHSDNRTSRSH